MLGHGTFLLSAALICVGGAWSGARSEAPRTVTKIDFAKDVQPILAAHCAKCHGSENPKGGLRVDRRDSLLSGGDGFGPAVVPGKSAESPLFQFVAGENADLKMPPAGPRLSQKEIDVLRDWIDQGAIWPSQVDTKPAAELPAHWAFRLVQKPLLPKVARKDWPRNAIDRFILSRQEQAGIPPSTDADRATLIRRVMFDLVGMPPTPEEVAAFVSDNAPDAYERLVDRLLASPHFGERWARHWLDVVRFAESEGFETNQPRPNAWPYRDYVIRSFNADQPFDRFIVEQIAGDTLGIDEATGFIVGGARDGVKSPDPVLTAQQRADELHDMVSTTGSAFLGLTVGCARCHAHKFDPVSQTDYYALTAVFAGVQHGERPYKRANETERQRRLDKVRGELVEVERALKRYEPRAVRLRPAITRGKNVDRFPAVQAKYLRFTVLATSQLEPCLDELEVFSADPQPRNVALASLGTKATASSTLPGYDIHKLGHVNDGLYGNSHSWISNESGRGWVQLEFPDPVTIDCVQWSRDREEVPRFNDRLPTRYRIEVATEPDRWQVVASDEGRLPFGTPVSRGLAYSSAGLAGDDLTRFEALVRKQERLQSHVTELERPSLAYAGWLTTPGPTYRLFRGDPMSPKEPVPPGALSQLGPNLNLTPEATDPERRKALAAWIVDPHNPLTARVIVNRLWQQHFGEGLVATPSDFGVNGAVPSHPDLLDWLADELVAHRWSLKHLHRLIVTSSTYRQSSATLEIGLAKDAGSRLLWRYPPRRLEAEPLRDAILAVSGNLDTQMGGPGFDLFEPNTNYVKVYNSKTRFGPEESRRMVYQTKPRMQLDDTFGAFDCPDAGQIAPRRTRSTTPLQALNLLNSTFLIQQSHSFAARLEREAGFHVEKQARRGFLLAFQREPAADELAAAAQLIREEGLFVFCRALFNANEFLTIF